MLQLFILSFIRKTEWKDIMNQNIHPYSPRRLCQLLVLVFLIVGSIFPVQPVSANNAEFAPTDPPDENSLPLSDDQLEAISRAPYSPEEPRFLDGITTPSDHLSGSTSTLEDTDSRFTYSTTPLTWTTVTDASASGGTYHSTLVNNAWAQISFTGTQFSLVYAQSNNYGVLDLYLDGSYFFSINQNNGGSTEYQTVWQSAMLASGDHTLRVQRSTTSAIGSPVNLDAVILVDSINWNDDFGDATVINMNYNRYNVIEDTTGATTAFDDPLIPCLSNSQGHHTVWFSYTAAENGYLALDTAVSAYNTVLAAWVGTRSNLSLVACNNSGTTNSSATFRVYKNSTYYLEVSGLNAYAYGILKFNATFTAIDTPVLYDDRDPKVRYEGTWFNETNAGAIYSTLKYSRAYGNRASLTFNGTQVSVIYDKGPGLGEMQIRIDNNLPITISQTTDNRTFQARWNSPMLEIGLHTITVSHLSGARIDLDAFVVSASFAPTAPGVGTYDDTSTYMNYSASWRTQTGPRYYERTIHYSTSIGNTVSFTFSGSQFAIIYSARSNRGKMHVFLDGVYITTINQYSSSSKYQKKWTSASFENKEHTVTLQHAKGR